MATVHQIVVELDVGMDASTVTRALLLTADLMARLCVGVASGAIQIIPKLVVCNYDADSRDLQRIPEAALFFRMVVRCGWYGLVRHPTTLGMLSALRPGCSEDEEVEFWTPILIGYCPDGTLNPVAFFPVVAESCAAFNLARPV